MSDFVLQYDILEGIAKRSNSLGRQADEYANSLTSRVANAITSVTGTSSGYLEDASYYVNEKVGQLQKKALEFYDFAAQVIILAETATRVDEEVQKLLEESQEEFLQHHESLRIDDWKADILNWLVGVKNRLPFLEVLGNILSAVKTLLETCLASIKYWYYCEGGKYVVEFVASIAVAVLAVTLFIVALSTFAAVVAVAGGFVAICGAIGAGIAAVNATTNVATSLRAANTACNGDPTWARIYSKQNTLSEVIRETNFNNGTLNGLSYLGADVIDATEMFCDIVAIVEIGRSLPKLFAKKNFNIFRSFRLEDFKTGMKNSFVDIKVGIKKGFTDFQGNVKDGYTYFKTNIKNGLFGKVDNVVVDDILSKGGSYSNLADGMSAVDKAKYIENNEVKFFNEFSERASLSGLDNAQISEAYEAMGAGDYEKMASYFDTSSPVDGAIFWSGNKNGAAVYADGIGGTIMEQTSGGQVFDEWRGLQGMYPEWDTGTMPQKSIWDALSSQYANGVEGVATYVHPSGYEGNVWRNIEKPILDENDIIINEVILNAK